MIVWVSEMIVSGMKYFMFCAITYSLSHAHWFFDNINVNAYSVSRKYAHIVELLVWWEKNSKINFSAGWYVYERSDIEYIIIYVNKTAIRIRCLIYWRGSRVGLFGRKSEKKYIRKTSKTLCETDRKGNPPMYKSKSFSIRKMATTTGRRRGAKHTIFACIRLRGCLVSLRDFSTGNWPFCTAGGAWFSDSYLTRKTL